MGKETASDGGVPENRLGRVDWFITDHLGSTKLLIDQTGQHRFTGDDDPFGINLRSFGDKDSHRYTGQILDEEQGLYYYGARYYLPEIGRFLSTDPAKEYASLYLYVRGNPINKSDPDGNQEATMSAMTPEMAQASAKYMQRLQMQKQMDDAAKTIDPSIRSQVRFFSNMMAAPFISINDGANNLGKGIFDVQLSNGKRFLLGTLGILEIASGGAALYSVGKVALPESRKAVMTWPTRDDDFSKMLGMQPSKIGITRDGTKRVIWEPNANTRIRYESHPHGLSPGDPGFNPRHHGIHYHVEVKPDGISWAQAGKRDLITKIEPPGYTLGSGTGFTPGENLPGAR